MNRAVTLPREYELCERTGRIGAFDLMWKKGDPNPPHIFWDSDVAKWIEAAAYSLATHPDPALEALLDEVIAKIGKAQQPDGYLNTHYIVFEKAELENRWVNLRDNHELYCAGHLFEAAVAHYQATGKRTLLDPMLKFADYIDKTFGPGRGKKRGYCGHQEIELALVKLYHVTGHKRYLKLAQYFIDERGRGKVGSKTPRQGRDHYYDVEAVARGEDPARWHFARGKDAAHRYEYEQAHLEVRDQRVVTGHAVRAVYMYCAMADIANETGDETLLAVCERLWHSIVDERMYLTGGIGPSASNEGFTFAYDLPDETAYAETCASVAMVFWNHRMLQFAGDGKYADVMERALFNGSLSGVSLDGHQFFYENPLASAGHHHRQGWFDCACCPPNIARLIASIGGYFYSTSDDGVWTHLYASGSAEIAAHGIKISQEANYPWDGNATLTLSMAEPKALALYLRVPGWCQKFSVKVGKEKLRNLTPENGYIKVEREWHDGDVITLALEMPVQLMQANPKVRQTLGRVAMQRGPLVYCLESADNAVAPLDRVALSVHTRFGEEFKPDLLGGVVVLHAKANVLDDGRWRDEAKGANALYTPASRIKQTRAEVTAVPYCTWDNRVMDSDPSEMRVWFRQS